jgi:hypothetical protein
MVDETVLIHARHLVVSFFGDKHKKSVKTKTGIGFNSKSSPWLSMISAIPSVRFGLVKKAIYLICLSV